jgi:tetraacyldisaccharide 4'-kinase
MIDREEKLKRALLWLPAKLYELAVRLRVFAYEKGPLRPRRLKAIVISVGNLTVGGTGKTPVVGYLARYLLHEGCKVAILTRGYRRRSTGRQVLNDPRHPQAKGLHYLEFGDEPLMLARALPQVPIVVDKNRYEGGLWALQELGAEALILDDGYQHLAVHRDLNILLIDATDPFGGSEMVPFGRLREPLKALKRADLVIITRANQPFDKPQTLQRIKDRCGEKTKIFYFHSSITKFKLLTTGENFNKDEFAGQKVAVMCGLGNPQAFIDDLRQLGLQIISENRFADHYAYAQADLNRVNQAARQSGAMAIITTEKDAVRLEGLNCTGMPIYAAMLEMQSADAAGFQSLLSRHLIKR